MRFPVPCTVWMHHDAQAPPKATASTCLYLLTMACSISDVFASSSTCELTDANLSDFQLPTCHCSRSRRETVQAFLARLQQPNLVGTWHLTHVKRWSVRV